jgi:D-threo-aldose 1-dehydrogenase
VPALARGPLGRTGLSVTNLCIGTSALGNMPRVYGYEVDRARALETLRSVFSSTIGFVDTSNGYGDGESERMIGEVLQGRGGLPPGILLSTKVDPSSSGDYSGDRVRRSVEESLERLHLEHLPLVSLHDPEQISFEEALAADGPVLMLLQLQHEGVIGHLGVAGGPVALMRRYVETGYFEVLITHNRYTLLERSAEPLIEVCLKLGVAVVNGAPFGGGMLARGPALEPRYCYRAAPEAVLAKAYEIERICQRHGVPLAAAALQFSMRNPSITSTIVGVTRPERAAEAISLAEMDLSEELWDELEPVSARDKSWLG